MPGQKPSVSDNKIMDLYNRRRQQMSLSVILDLKGGDKSPNNAELLSETTKTTGTEKRKSLFNFGRDIFSLKQQVSMAKVREYLAGSGKNSENSTHFSLTKASNFRANPMRATRNDTF